MNPKNSIARLIELFGVNSVLLSVIEVCHEKSFISAHTGDMNSAKKWEDIGNAIDEAISIVERLN